MRKIIIFSVIFWSFSSVFCKEFLFTINPDLERKPISAYIYGASQTLTETENWAARRIGGNRMTGYNWENNASNAGQDWEHSSDNYLTWINNISSQEETIPAIVLTKFIDKAINYNNYALITLQMAGYVAKDKNGTVTEDETAPSNRWAAVQAAKGSSFSLTPDLADNTVYIDELVNFLVTRYGNASTSTGVKAYCLDNEPGLWSDTHPRIHPEKTGCVELITRSVALSKAVKNVDPFCDIHGPALYGMSAYINLADDGWNDVKGSYKWYIDYYLAEMNKAGQADGRRLLDVLDIHWYPEAQGDERIVNSAANSRKDKEARLQAPRSLWDKGYYENSWIGQWFKEYLPLIPTLLESIDNHYPGTKLAINEYNYGGENDVTGGIATADVLGIFGKLGVYAACYWQMQEQTDYTSAALRLYRNYDHTGSTFGDMSVQAATDDKVNSSVYAAITGSNPAELHIVALNKDLDAAAECEIQIAGNMNYTSGEVWYFDADSPEVRYGGVITNIQNNILNYTLPRSSASHFVLYGAPTQVTRDNQTPENFTLSAYPNPFNSSCVICYEIPSGETADLTIYDITGREVKLLMNLQGTGRYTWNACDNNGNVVAAGNFFIKLTTPSHEIIKRASFIK